LVIVIGLIVFGSTVLHAQAEPAGSDATQTNRPQRISSEYEQKPILKSGAGAPTSSGSNENRPGPGYWLYMILALGFVIVLIFIGASVLRKAYPGGRVFSSFAGIEVLGRTHLSPKQTLAMVKVNRKLLLLGLTEHHITQLSTFSDPQEVSQLLAQIEQHRPSSITSGFMHLFKSERKNYKSESASQPLENVTGELQPEISSENAEEGILELKAEINSLLDKVNRLKGIGG
jgi:flagellar biogenesis protein FliO